MNYERQLSRLREMVLKLEEKHTGKEMNYTYHGGFSLGYLKGQVSILEEIVSDRDGRT
tara:strand:+ start:1321 stop:1494 length:174 start_codon:yes stop_codon:yes gene_type:complete